jgi:hypothetical protein
MANIINSSSKTDSSTFSQTLISSALGGALGGYICYPGESLKKRAQVTKLEITHFYPRELFRGSVPFALAVMVASTTSMTFNALLKSLPAYDCESHIWNATLALGSGMLGAVVGSTPVENTILTQQQFKLSPMHAIKKMMSQGILRPWVGVKELMAREAGFAGVMLFASPEARKFTLAATESETLATCAQIGVGILGAIATHPADTMATYRQKMDGEITSKQVASKIYREMGLKGFFRGVLYRSLLFTGCSLIIPIGAKLVKEELFDK